MPEFKLKMQQIIIFIYILSISARANPREPHEYDKHTKVYIVKKKGLKYGKLNTYR